MGLAWQSGWWQSVTAQCKSCCRLACHARLSTKHGTFMSGEGQVLHKVLCSVIISDDTVGDLEQTDKASEDESSRTRMHGLGQ